MSNIKVSINILNYNTFEKSKVCIDSCLKQKGVEYQVLLIDNNSTDDSLERLKALYGDRIKYLENDDNYGFAKGNNIGVQYCLEQGIKYSFLLNSDTELVGETLIQKLLKIIESQKDCAVVAPTIYDVTSSGLILHSNDSTYLKMLRIGGVIPALKTVTENIQTVSEAHGSALFVDNLTFLAVGGFPEHYFMYGEESTFAKKIQWEGKFIFFIKDESNYILHHHDKSGAVTPWRLYLMGRNRGLEYWENRQVSPIKWTVIFYIHKCINRIRGILIKNNYFNLGIKESYSIYLSHCTKEECYESAKASLTRF